MIGYDDIHWQIFAASCVAKGDKFGTVLKEMNIQPKITVEVGTHKGLSTAVLASISEKVYTFDIEHFPLAEPLWKLLKVRDKIINVIVPCTADIGHYLEKHNICPDFVFADGPHTRYIDVRRIFDIFVNLGVKRILFDDAVKRFPGTLQLAKEFKMKIFYDRFAYWEREINESKTT